MKESKITFTVVLLGGSIGEQTIRNVRVLKNKVVPFTNNYYFTVKADAKSKAKNLTKSLSAGEKSYYKMKYVVAEISNGLYTGK